MTADLLLLLLLDLPDNSQIQAQNNTVVPSQKEMDWVGFEPTTLAMPATL